jgi:FkbM family methyltransferase
MSTSFGSNDIQFEARIVCSEEAFTVSLVRRMRGQARRVRDRVRRGLQSAVRLAVAGRSTRAAMNWVYNRFTMKQRGAFHERYAKLFRAGNHRLRSGTWRVNFAGRQVTIPLTENRAWLDWDNAVSIVGHDVEVKETYSHLLRSSAPPELFVDVGANYGLHSLLFLAQGIEVLSFEPNPACRQYMRDLCTANSLTPHIEAVALGDVPGQVELTYPAHDTWHGSTDSAVAQALKSTFDVATETVPQRTLDDYQTNFGKKRMLVKIDTEGSEYRILRGAERTLRENRPLLIFESLAGERRQELFELLSAAGYTIACLPWASDQTSHELTLEHFLKLHATNFIALPDVKSS